MASDFEQRRLEKETQIYSAFMRVAKKVTQIEYGKWQIVPDSADPLRKFSLVRKTDYGLLNVNLDLKQTYHRGVYTVDRYDWKGCITLSGLYKSYNMSAKKLFVRPRLAKDLIEFINTQILPNFEKDIERTKVEEEKRLAQNEKQKMNIASIKGLTVSPSRDWDGPIALLNNCPFSIRVQSDGVRMTGDISYQELQKIAIAMKWGDYK